MLEYVLVDSNSNFGVNEIKNFIAQEDYAFSPKISLKVDINDYAKKLYSLAVIFICHHKGEIVGLSAFYCQPAVYSNAFLSYLAVNKDYRKQGIAKTLILQMIKYCQKMDMNGIATSTWAGNKAIELYEANGFRKVGGIEINRIELYYEFVK